jgi:hypothetical protein
MTLTVLNPLPYIITGDEIVLFELSSDMKDDFIIIMLVHSLTRG